MSKKNKKKNIITIIPARLKSRRLSEKLLRKINKIPMIVRVAKKAQSLNYGDVIVATDNKKIYNLCDRNNIISLMTDKQHKSGTDRVYEAYSILKKKRT